MDVYNTGFTLCISHSNVAVGMSKFEDDKYVKFAIHPLQSLSQTK
jgi:hypothetical protein